MAKNKRSRDEAETYDSDDGFVSNDDGNAPKSKKSKKAGASKPASGDDEQFWAVSLIPSQLSFSNHRTAFIREKPTSSQHHRVQEQQVGQYQRVL